MALLAGASVCEIALASVGLLVVLPRNDVDDGSDKKGAFSACLVQGSERAASSSAPFGSSSMSFQTNQTVATRRSNLCHYLEAHCVPSSMDGHMNARLSLSFYSYTGYGFGRGVIVRVEISCPTRSVSGRNRFRTWFGHQQNNKFLADFQYLFGHFRLVLPRLGSARLSELPRG